ncbi:hypothetical protein BV898_06471 [Hypsibius exemplaris]|uniref:Secreted protein n=1 Tax=Hypsibius exemplaris TaxID=2072580 RepID=A0A1W0WWA5_HYPEX|nr:hypothetical protein BV898_06471 [Hypsibius exemplaris]
MKCLLLSCFTCCVVASAWKASFAVQWTEPATAILEEKVFSSWTRGRRNKSCGISTDASRTPDKDSTRSSCPEEPRVSDFKRRHNLAFHPRAFDDMFSIDKRGNTLHFVDDCRSVAKMSYPLLALSLRPRWTSSSIHSITELL